MSTKFGYEVVPGFFAQDTPKEPISAVPPRFGLLDMSEDRWANLRKTLVQMNSDGDSSTSYKLIMFGRHGQGFHNVGEAKYGTEAWDAYWAKLNGDGELVWGPDPELTSLGEDQARAVHQVWVEELKADLHLPSKMYCSPMTRALNTHRLTFEGLLSATQKGLILEDCREHYTDHTCDKRRTKSYIQERFPSYDIEEGFTEEDLRYTGDEKTGETPEELVLRARSVLDRVFQDNDTEADLISVTAHGGIINGFLMNITRSLYNLPTGGVIPLIVKASRVE